MIWTVRFSFLYHGFAVIVFIWICFVLEGRKGLPFEYRRQRPWTFKTRNKRQLNRNFEPTVQYYGFFSFCDYSFTPCTQKKGPHFMDPYWQKPYLLSYKKYTMTIRVTTMLFDVCTNYRCWGYKILCSIKKTSLFYWFHKFFVNFSTGGKYCFEHKSRDIVHRPALLERKWSVAGIPR